METHEQTTASGARTGPIAPAPPPAAAPAATPPGTPGTPPDGKPRDARRKPLRDAELEEACRKLAEAAHEVAWAAYLLGRRQRPGGRADPPRVRGLGQALIGLLTTLGEVKVSPGTAGILYDREIARALSRARVYVGLGRIAELSALAAPDEEPWPVFIGVPAPAKERMAHS